jgi:hypothetical protein
MRKLAVMNKVSDVQRITTQIAAKIAKEDPRLNT